MADPVNPPTAQNTVGTTVNIVASVMLVIMTIVVGMRIWGRYRYRIPGGAARASLGDSRFWVLMSDLMIIIAYLSAVALSAAQFNYVTWGLGLHVVQLTKPQLAQAMKAFFAYQIIYKFCSGMSKIASLFLLVAIATPEMRVFINTCKLFAFYIGLYSIATTLVTVFQCQLNFEANWNKTVDQSKCFTQPPFWYAHGVINLTASFFMAFLPWWLFSKVQYKRKYIISTIMSFLALAETALGVVRLYGLIHAASDSSDITFSSYIGLPVSQIEVDFATIAACIPTVLRLGEELWVLFCVHVLRQPAVFSNGGTGSGTRRPTGQGHVQLSGLKSVDHEFRSSNRRSDPNAIGSDSEDEILPSAIKKVTQISVNSSPGSMESLGKNWHQQIPPLRAPSNRENR